MKTLDSFIDAQPKVIKILKNSIEQNRLSHAYIFEGIKGTKKFRIAKELAKNIICGCDDCDNCLKIDKQSHSNLIIVEPSGQTIKKEQIKNLISELNMTSLIAGARVYIINHIDKMTLSAANSLLKYFEEPHDNVYAILITENISHILRTIKSRAQTISFTKVSEKYIRDSLLNQDVNPKHAYVLQTMTNSADEALKLSESEEFIKVFDLFEKLMQAIADKSHQQIIYFKEKGNFINRENINILLDLMIIFYSDLINLKNEQQPKFITSSALYSLQQLPLEKVVDDLKYILKVKTNVKYYANLALSLDMLLAQIDWR